MNAYNGVLEAQNRVVEGLVAADSHPFHEKQDPDPDPHQSEKLDSNTYQRDPDPQHCPLPFQLPTADAHTEPDNLEHFSRRLAFALFPASSKRVFTFLYGQKLTKY